MKNKLVGLIIFVAWGFASLPAAAQNATVPNGKFAQNKSPVEITSDRMQSEDGGAKIIFSGNVVSSQGDLKITSDIMEIHNTKGNKKTDEIVAIGNVVITKGLRKAVGDRAVYVDKLQKITLTGTPHATAWEEESMIEGQEMIFLLEQDRFIVNQRVRMKVYLKDEKKL